MTSQPGAAERAFWDDTDDAVARHRDLLDAVDVGVYRLDADGAFLAVNDAFVATTGYARETLLGEHVSLLLDADGLDRLEREVGRQRDSLDATPVELSVRTAGGGTLPCSVRVDPVLADGEFRGTVGIVECDAAPEPSTGGSVRAPTDFLLTIIEETEGAAFVLDDAFEIVWADVSIGRYFGADAADLVGRDKRQVVHELKRAVEDPDRFAGRVLATYDDNSSIEEFECHVTAGDGREERWLEHWSRPIASGPYAGGRIECYTDVSERKQSADALEETEEQFDSLVDALTEYAIFRLDPDGTVASWNQGAAAIKGYEAEEVVGEHFSAFYTREDRAAGVPGRNLERAADDGSIEDEGWRVRKDGSRFWANVTISAVRDGEGVLEGYLKVTRDMTEQHEYQKGLEHELHHILDRVSDGFFGLDSEWRLTYINERAADLIEVTPERATGEMLWDLFPETVDSPFEEHYRRAMSEQVPVAFEEYFPPLEAWFEVSAYPSETGLSVYFRDVTERKRRQQQLEASNERLEQFAYAASHDLQEPLRMVSSYLQLIERRYADRLDDDGREFLEFAVDGADRMRAMIDGLLAYSRIESEGAAFEPVELEAVLADVREDLQLLWDEHDPEITVGSLPRVEGDRDQLRQLFQNLLDNAITYSGDARPRIHVSAERDGEAWVCAVRDEGVGIDPADADRIFEVFQSLDGPDEDGSGIGLALCKRIVERHGGDIRVDSTPGEGATFSFTLPACGGDDD